MTNGIPRRLAQAVVVLWAAFTLSFVILYLLPGDAVLAKLGGGDGGSTVTAADVAGERAALGLDDPLVVQYGKRLVAAARGDFGRSIATGEDAATLVLNALPSTLSITGLGLLFAVVFGGAIAILGTYTRSRLLSQFLASLPPLGNSLPSFWVGLVLIQVFSFTLGWVPALGSDGFSALVLPAVTLALPTGAIIGQVLAKSLRTQLDEPYVEVVLAKGASRARVHFGHVLRNAALPALTLVGVIAGNLLAGSVITESVFSRDGIGRVTASAVSAQDIPVVQAVIVLAALFFVVLNLAVDLLYPVLDPRLAGRVTAKAVSSA
ncbi:ABC transporter permease [Actinokineospora cianjurensis]|uniref:Peptide/nickel transport system permease protein n=1 Tax=Actinokineospora cianjurensis TaxID=585224 RepID=A0A421AYJ0_9PSEU|nr:ABC transporter permease [Actinokineospora cianjurensis]RLK54933.1 peptide/nickel transport system permease protein [Actinokineospora cianjurensis]